MPTDQPGPLLIEVALEPRSKAEQEALGEALARMAGADLSIRIEVHEESGQCLLQGMSELQLDDLIGRLIDEFGVGLNVGAPQILYRETITRSVEVDYTHKTQTGGVGRFARVTLAIEPAGDGAAPVFEDCSEGVLPPEYIDGARRGVDSVFRSGPKAGFRMIGLRVALTGGTFHEADSSPVAFETAARAAGREGMRKADLQLLEPVMQVDVMAPAGNLRAVVGDLFARRGVVRAERTEGNTAHVGALVPLSTMFGYINTLRGMTSGAGDFAMVFDHYQDVPSAGHDGPDDTVPQAMAMRA